MKLITEMVETVPYLIEEKEGKKNYFLQGIFLQSELENRNNRIYPKEIMKREVDRYVKEYVEQKRAFGELGHPATPTINLDRVSHMIVELKQDGNNFLGKAKILDTPFGKIVKNLMDEGAKLGVSSRGLGSLKEIKETKVVQDDFYLATAADIVADPSAPDAFVQGIMENKEWVIINDNFQVIEEIKKDVLSASSKQLDEVKLRAFERFLKTI